MSLGLGASGCWILYNQVPTTTAMIWGILISVFYCWIGEISDSFNQIVWKASKGLPHLYTAAWFGKVALKRLMRPALSDFICLGMLVLNIVTIVKLIPIGNELLNQFTTEWSAHFYYFMMCGVFGFVSIFAPCMFLLLSLVSRKIEKPLDFWWHSVVYNLAVLHLIFAIVAVGLVITVIGYLTYLAGSSLVTAATVVWNRRVLIWAAVMAQVYRVTRTAALCWNFGINLIKQTGIFVGRLVQFSWFFIHADSVRTTFFYSVGVVLSTNTVRESGADFVGGLIICFLVGATVGTAHNYMKSRYRTIFPTLLARL